MLEWCQGQGKWHQFQKCFLWVKLCTYKQKCICEFGSSCFIHERDQNHQHFITMLFFATLTVPGHPEYRKINGIPQLSARDDQNWAHYIVCIRFQVEYCWPYICSLFLHLRVVNAFFRKCTTCYCAFYSIFITFSCDCFKNLPFWWVLKHSAWRKRPVCRHKIRFPHKSSHWFQQNVFQLCKNITNLGMSSFL